MDVALLVLRVVVGLLVAGYGAQKLFGWFGGHGIGGFAKGLESMGFRPAQLWAWLAGIAEFAGGVLFTVGLLNPLGSIGIASSMLTAIARVHWPRVWATDRGLELPLTYLVVALTVGAVGPGQYALDTVLRVAVPHSVTVLILTLAVVGWLVGMTLSARRPLPLQRDS